MSTAMNDGPVSIAGGETQPIRLIHEFKLYKQVWQRLWDHRVAQYKAQREEQREQAASSEPMPKA